MRLFTTTANVRIITVMNVAPFPSLAYRRRFLAARLALKIPISRSELRQPRPSFTSINHNVHATREGNVIRAALNGRFPRGKAIKVSFSRVPDISDRLNEPN